MTVNMAFLEFSLELCPTENGSSNFITDRPTFSIILQTTFIVLATLLIVGGNIINIIILHTTPLWHRSTTLLLKNLSVADCCIGLSFTISAIYPSAANLESWPFGDFLCNLTSIVGGTCCGASIVTLALISVDRYFIVLHPLDHEKYMSKRKVRIFIFLAWIIPLTEHLTLFSEKFCAFYNRGAFLCTAHYSDSSALVTISFFIFVPTNLIILFTYASIIPISIKHSKSIRNSYKQGTNSQVVPRKATAIGKGGNKAIYTLLLITLVFNVCWAPMAFAVFLELINLFNEGDSSQRLEFTFAWLAMSNSFLNTFVYMAMNKRYRKAVRRLLTCYRKSVYYPTSICPSYHSSSINITELHILGRDDP